MLFLTITDTLQLLCKSTNKYGIYISYTSGNDSYLGMSKAAPYLEIDESLSGQVCNQILLDGQGYILFNTEEEVFEIFDQTVGDDGPTSRNSYSGTNRVYALVCDNKGNLMTENT